MTLDLWFWATTEQDARKQAREWAAAEPNVEECRITAVRGQEPWFSRWVVSVELTLRSDYAQPTFWGDAA